MNQIVDQHVGSASLDSVLTVSKSTPIRLLSILLTEMSKREPYSLEEEAVNVVSHVPRIGFQMFSRHAELKQCETLLLTR